MSAAAKLRAALSPEVIARRGLAIRAGWAKRRARLAQP
jgi:hypothetical protein